MTWEFSNGKLVEEIEATRQTMVLVGMEYGFTHSDTVYLSTKLDELLNVLYKKDK